MNTNTNCDKEDYGLFGASSLLFIIASLYWIYTMFLIILPIISYLCNTNYHVPYQVLDHLNTLFIGLTYLFLHKQYHLCVFILIVAFIEFFIYKSVVYSAMISFTFFVYVAFSKFTNNQYKIGMVCLIMTIFSYIQRDTKHPSYKLYTIIWHTCNMILLVFVADTLSNQPSC